MSQDPVNVPVFLDLGTLLNESIELKKQQDAEKDLRKRVARGAMPKGELEESQALLRKWSNEREWVRAKNVLVFNRQRCKNCGMFHQTLEGFFEQYNNNRLANTTKLVHVPAFELPNLMRDVEYRDSEVPICHQCADMAGWELEED